MNRRVVGATTLLLHSGFPSPCPPISEMTGGGSAPHRNEAVKAKVDAKAKAVALLSRGPTLPVAKAAGQGRR